MSLTIRKRKLSRKEISLLATETRRSTHIGYIAPAVWEEFANVYVASDGGKLIGVCAAISLREYIKLGPIIVLEQYRGKQVGSKLLSHVVESLADKPLYVGSSNERVRRIVLNLGFIEMTYWRLPLEIKRYLLSYIWQRRGVDYILDSLSKIWREKRGKYRYYLKIPLQPLDT